MNGLRSARSGRRSATIGPVVALLAGILATGVADAATATIVMEHYVFSPSPLTIVAGTVVTWVNKDPTEHQVVSDTGAFPSSKVLKPGEKFSVKFSKAGTFNYHDGFGGFMSGTIIVTGVAKATPKPTAKPTPKPTAKPTPKPTAPPTAAPTVDVTAVPSVGAASPSPAAGTPGSGGAGTPGPSGGSGSGSGSGSDSGGGPFDVGGIVIGFGLAVLAFLAGIGIQAIRRERASLPPDGGPGAGASAVASPVAASAAAPAGPQATPDPTEPVGDTGPTPEPEPDIDEDRPLSSRR